MRRLLVLAPLLLTSCALLRAAGVSDPNVFTGGVDRISYEIDCDHVPLDGCVPEAQALAKDHYLTSRAPVISISIADDGARTICWKTTTGPSCSITQH